MDSFQKDLSPTRPGTVAEGQEHRLMKSGWRLLRSLPPGTCLSPVPGKIAVTAGAGEEAERRELGGMERR